MMKSLPLIVAFSAVLLGCGSNQQQEAEKQEPATSVADSSSFTETHRLQFHFTPPNAWMNDPNGMVYHEGEYHLFYQHNPDSTVWGPMHWGHAVSKDLVHWEHLPIGLYPDSLGTIFSGSAVVDLNNTSGLGTTDNPPLVAIYTYHDAEGERAGRNDFQTQGIAYSLDKGRNWTKWEGNPALANPGIRDFRDPKVMWHEGEQKWVMALAVADHISFYSSKNLKEWQHMSDFGAQVGAHGGVWECPDLFKLKVEETGEEKWVLLVSINPGGPNGGSATQYFVGNFDGSRFEADKMFLDAAGNKGIWIDWGRDNYAGVTWSNIPEDDGRRLFMGWMSNWQYANVVPTENWRSAMTVARSLHLANTPAGLRLLSRPVEELEKLYENTRQLEAQVISDSLNISEVHDFNSSTFALQLALTADEASKGFALELSNNKGQKVIVGYDAGRQAYYTDRRQSGNHQFSAEFPSIHYGPRLQLGQEHSLHLLVDVASLELFADGGRTVMTDIFFSDEPFTNIILKTEGGQLSLKSGQLNSLKSIWTGALQ